MVKNYFYLIVGILCILFAVTHTLNGVTSVLQTLENSAIEENARVAFTYVWHIIGIENLIFGVALLIMSFQKDMSKVKFAAWLIIMILGMRWIIISMFTLLSSNSNLTQLIPDTVAIFIVITLLFIGTRKESKFTNE